MTSPVFIHTNAALAQHAARWATCDVLALDTEFIRTRTYYPIAALIQIYDGAQCYLIDPLPLTDFNPLADILRNPAIVKVLHSGSEDLEVLERLTGALPTPLFDTQLAAPFCGMAFSLGYANLVQQVYDISLSKEQTRSDWLQRPLSAEQISYACQDVDHLYNVYQHFAPLLAQSGRRAWVDEEAGKLMANHQDLQDTTHAWRRLKGAWKLDARTCAVLRDMAQWREVTAREQNVPRKRLLENDVLYTIAQQQPTTLHALGNIEGMPPRVVRHWGDAIVALVKHALALPEAQLPTPPPRPLPRDIAGLVNCLQATCDSVAQTHNIPQEMLARRQDIDAIARSWLTTGTATLPPLLAHGWRHNIIGTPLLSAASNWHASK